jgi:hypothetical protein
MTINKHSILYKTLNRALSMKRPHGTKSVTKFTKWLEAKVPKHALLYYDTIGNLHIDARTDAAHRTLFVAHVDTVHRETGANKIRKTKGMWYADGACLGADDGAGCAMLMHLLHSGTPGYYIFTQGEERGGIGAKHLARRQAKMLGEFDRAIAFDRRGIDSVITHQGWGRCCSDEFAAALSGELCADGVLMYLGDDTGVYTDTAEFIDIIPECTNISVGYDHEHSDRETLDIYHFEALAAAVIKIDWDKLPTVRDPSYVEPPPPPYRYGNWANPSAVDLSLWDGKLVDADDEYDDDLFVQECIRDALHGLYGDLLDLIANAAYPEDPDMARKFLNKKLLTDEVLEQALSDCQTYDAETVLLFLFDAAHCEV